MDTPNTPKIPIPVTLVNLSVNEQVVDLAARVTEDLGYILNWIERGRIDLAKERLAMAQNNASLVSGALINAYQAR